VYTCNEGIPIEGNLTVTMLSFYYFCSNAVRGYKWNLHNSKYDQNQGLSDIQYLMHKSILFHTTTLYGLHNKCTEDEGNINTYDTRQLKESIKTFK
jgi:hypothetical protein